ncbi:taste receptor type 1 member 1-like [Polyodon spathula]|uniref:taste receptor type 1 member 1-like n=1 Tax=Polyodon spathula TaxID=7913 RepID=UPI001B7F4E6C|nr:taste receptor type 1 member 1-like [Polyodon spathula]
MLRNIVYLNVKVVVVFATGQPVTDLMRQAIASNVGGIVWVASEAWSLISPEYEEFLERELSKEVFSVLASSQQSGILQPAVQRDLCIRYPGLDSTSRFSVYSAVYAVAHALHRVLKCDEKICKRSEPVFPYQIPVALGSQDCILGFKKTLFGTHTCFFNCEPCAAGTFVNQSDPYNCQPCPEDEWSDDESAFCQKRTLEYLDYNDRFSIGLLVSAGLICTLSVATAVVFAVQHDTPVVKSAGGKMCFFMLGCLGISCLSIGCFIGVPTTWKCILRNPVFAVFFTACLCCLLVRTFQVICVFKIATKMPKVYEFWVKKNGQWMFVTVAVGLQIFLCGLWVGIEGPHPFNNTQAVRGQIIYDCGMGNMFAFTAVIAFVGLLSMLCFACSYFGKDLPKDYNDAKYVTYSLLVFFFTWDAYLTAYIVYSGKYIPVINAISVLASLASILVGYFIPKCYIILFKPQYNTTAHFQTCIQDYTKTISSK